ncbi:carbohydrate ABC transporter substrate-binding protein [Paenibacillus anaericanus]|uniref:Carbohydrate ABC transporter substrate-binding protein n=1 Tax=Paenibacillus anaericanus TaxID=170367 RepID=A0A3S1BNM2_9BACL|nr:ABC transporter substrate-binding protein [Paenibacillus anaericanus]RUT43766.1 carbohydrate ABC transporter substrate-binding protein [Paenibacillus anaericanus]
MKNRHICRMLILVICIVLGGCSAALPEKTTTPTILKVMYYDESIFYQEYGDLFITKYPNIEVQVVSTQNIDNDPEIDKATALAKLIEKEQPDVLWLDPEQYEQYAADGLLMELQTLIQKEHYDIEGIYPTIVDLIKEKSAGKLYGLSPRFYGNALFYNADLFAEYGIDPPHNQMTWKEILNLAKRFPVDGGDEDRVYGLGMQSYITSDIQTDTLAGLMARTQGMSTVNYSTMKVTVNTDSWKDIWKTAFEATESKAIYTPEEPFWGGSTEEFYKNQPFIMGRVAMVVDSADLLQHFKEVRDRVKEFKPFELGIVTGPVDPSDPSTSRDVELYEIFSIRAGSPNAEAAWDFIKYVNGDDYARVKSKTLNGNMLSRMGYYKDYVASGIEAFYKLKPKPVNYGSRGKVPTGFYSTFEELMKRELERVKNKEITVDEALGNVEAEGQTLLDQAQATSP